MSPQEAFPMELAGSILIGLMGMAAFGLGHLIGQSLRSRRLESRERRAAPPASYVPAPRPARSVGPGPLWQNSRIFEEELSRGRAINIDFIQAVDLPEFPHHTQSRQPSQEDEEESHAWRFAGGRQDRLG